MTTHPEWCTRAYSCPFGEHRAIPAVFTALDAAGAPTATAAVTRIGDPAGRELVEIRLRVALPADERAARHRLARTLAELDALLHRLAA
jgi:hypothetical protein